MTETLAQGLSAYIHARTEGGQGAPLLLTLHGTGGDERQFHGLGAGLMPGAHVVSPRGDVMEGPHARFFRRTGMGVYDMDDLARAVEKLAAFVEAAQEGTGAPRTAALGYSNGANVLAALSFSRPDLVDDIALMHPLIPWEPAPQPGLAGRRVLITAGRHDPIGPAVQTEALARYYEGQGAEIALDWHAGGHEIAESELAALRRFFA
jgi:phospholipase/carboxylesterase